MRGFALALCAFVLSACAAQPQRGYDRYFRPVANPGKVVATELAFARMAREEGQWTAFRHYAAPGAVIHGQTGPVEAAPWLARQDNPEQAVQWAPRELWSSCDGGTVISFGRFADPDRTFGYFVTVWERQGDGEYRYVYDFGWPDAELTAAERARLERASDESEGGILIEASSMIKAEIADCEKPDALFLNAAPELGKVKASQSYNSKDATLNWRWDQLPDGTRRFASYYLHDGEWAEALVRSIHPDGE